MTISINWVIAYLVVIFLSFTFGFSQQAVAVGHEQAVAIISFAPVAVLGLLLRLGEEVRLGSPTA